MSPAAPSPAEPESLALLGDAVEELVWSWDIASGKLVYANPAFLRWRGGRGGDAAATGADLLLADVHPEDRERLRQARRLLPRTGYLQEYRLATPGAGGGTAGWLRLREQAFATRGPAGEARITHVARDISWQFDTTAQLQLEISRRADAERSLTDATARLEALIATANDPVITIDAHSRIIDWNRAAERVFGWSRAEALGQALPDLIIPPAHRRNHDAGVHRYLRDGTAPIFNRRVETRALRRSGEEFDAELSVWPVRMGERITFSSFVRDISRRKAAAQALAASEAKYRTVVENVNEGILVTAGGRILYANRRSLELTGLDEATATSRPFIEFIHPDDRERVLANHLRRLRGEAVENHYQFRVLHPGGEVRWLEISAVVFEWQAAPATLNFLTDVTQRRQVEEDMRHALARERELSELKSRFVAVASHEFAPRWQPSCRRWNCWTTTDRGCRMPSGARSSA